MPATSNAVNYPSPTQDFYVNDTAEVLTADTSEFIIKESQNLQQQTGAQVAVLIVPSLEEQPIEDYALKILRDWGIGDKTKNNGVLILVSIGDKTSRIEVGYGLEGALNDAKTGRIQDEFMIPSFQQGNYAAGIVEGYKAVVNEIYKEYNIDYQLSMGGFVSPGVDNRASEKDSSKIGEFFKNLSLWQKILIGVIILILLILDWVFLGGEVTRFLLLMLISRGNRSGGGGGNSGGGGSGGGGGSSRRW